MRLMTILGLACLMLVPVCAAEQPAQPAKVSVSFSDADAGQALIELAQKAQLTVLGDATVKGKVNASLNNVTPEQALDTICRTNNLEWYKAYISVAPNEKPNAQKVLALIDSLKALGNTTVICQNVAKQQDTVFVPAAVAGSVDIGPVAEALKLKPVYVVRAIPKPVDPNAANQSALGTPPAEVTAAASQLWNYFSQMAPETQWQVMGQIGRMMRDSMTPEQRQAMYDRWRQERGGDRGGDWRGPRDGQRGDRPPGR